MGLDQDIGRLPIPFALPQPAHASSQFSLSTFLPPVQSEAVIALSGLRRLPKPQLLPETLPIRPMMSTAD